jgi:hypothetical protein
LSTHLHQERFPLLCKKVLYVLPLNPVRHTRTCSSCQAAVTYTNSLQQQQSAKSESSTTATRVRAASSVEGTAHDAPQHALSHETVACMKMSLLLCCCLQETWGSAATDALHAET